MVPLRNHWRKVDKAGSKVEERELTQAAPKLVEEHNHMFSVELDFG
jgi:hypothetical protein